jgi:hypothetical protein
MPSPASKKSKLHVRGSSAVRFLHHHHHPVIGGEPEIQPNWCSYLKRKFLLNPMRV